MDNLKSLSTDIFPGLDFMLYNQVTPLLCIDKNLLTAKASKIGLEFPIGMLEEPPLEENIEHASEQASGVEPVEDDPIQKRKRVPQIKYSYGLKFAFIFQPDNTELHEYILSKMDF